jgi:phage shock protein A
MADVGMAMDRAENKVQTMQARAGAIDELLESGALDDLSGTRGDDIDRELAQLSATSGVDSEIARMKAELGAGPASAPEQIEGGDKAP